MAVKKEKLKKIKKEVVVIPRTMRDVVFPVTLVVEGTSVSVNHLYGRFKNRTFLKPEGKLFKNQSIVSICEQLGFEYSVNEKTKEVTVTHGIREQLYTISYKIYTRWMTQKNTVLKADATNKIKIIEDALANAICIDDKFFWKTTIEKFHELDNQRIEITIDIYRETKT